MIPAESAVPDDQATRTSRAVTVHVPDAIHLKGTLTPALLVNQESMPTMVPLLNDPDPYVPLIRTELCRIMDWRRASLSRSALHTTKWRTPSMDCEIPHALVDELSDVIRKEAQKRWWHPASITAPGTGNAEAFHRLCWQELSKRLHNDLLQGDPEAEAVIWVLCERFIVEHASFRRIVAWAIELGEDPNHATAEVINRCIKGKIAVIKLIKRGKWTKPESLTMFLRTTWATRRLIEVARAYKTQTTEFDFVPLDGELTDDDRSLLDQIEQTTFGLPERVVQEKEIDHLLTVALLFQLLERIAGGALSREEFAVFFLEYCDPFPSKRGSKEKALEWIVDNPQELGAVLRDRYGLTENEATRVVTQLRCIFPSATKRGAWRRTRVNQAREGLNKSQEFNAWLEQVVRDYQLVDLIVEIAREQRDQALRTLREAKTAATQMPLSHADAISVKLQDIKALVDQTLAAAEEAMEVGAKGDVSDAILAMKFAIKSAKDAKDGLHRLFKR